MKVDKNYQERLKKVIAILDELYFTGETPVGFDNAPFDGTIERNGENTIEIAAKILKEFGIDGKTCYCRRCDKFSVDVCKMHIYEEDGEFYYYDTETIVE